MKADPMTAIRQMQRKIVHFRQTLKTHKPGTGAHTYALRQIVRLEANIAERLEAEK